jgi:hypothetical protein
MLMAGEAAAGAELGAELLALAVASAASLVGGVVNAWLFLVRLTG